MSNATIIKVRGYHLDVYQHVNNARYLEFLEEARWQWLEDHGAFDWMMKEAIAFMVVNLNINYRRGVLNQIITRTSDNEIIIDAALTFVCTDLRTQKALPLEGALRDRLLELSGDK